MALPKLNHTVYTHELTGLGTPVKFRPFTNQEQKTLLLAKEAKGSETEKETILNAIEQIVGNCTFGKVNAMNLATFDLEDLFLRIRAKSVGEMVTVKYRYDYRDEDDKPKSRFLSVDINIDEVKVQVQPNHNKTIMLSDSIGIVMKYPTFSMMKTSSNDETLAMACIDYVFDANEVYQMSGASKEEVIEFYDDIDVPGLLKIKEFFDTMPKLRHSVEVDLGDGTKETIVFEGLNDFFT